MSRAFNLSRAGIALIGDTSGNLGLGVTPSSWAFFTGNLELNNGNTFSGNASQNSLTQNAYYGSGGWTYKTSTYASRYQQISGAHAWHTAASGTAGNPITFTQAMTLDASGNLGINVSSPATRLHVDHSLKITSSFTGATATDGFSLDVRTDNGDVSLVNYENTNMVFYTNAAERMRLDSSGNLGVGTASPTNKLHVYTATGSLTGLVQSGNAGQASWKASNSRDYIQLAVDGANCYVDAGTASPLLFYTSSAEKMRLDASGNLLVSTTAAQGGQNGGIQVGSGLVSSATRNTKIIFANNYSNTTGLPAYWGNWQATGSWAIGSHDSSTQTVRIGVVSNDSGGAYWSGNYANVYAGAYTNASDYRIKDNVVNVGDGVLEKIMALRVVNYNIIAIPDEDGDTPPAKDEVGFIAHEIQEQFPVLVSGEKDGVDGNGGALHQGVDYAKLTAYLVKGMQEQQTIIEQLKSRLDAANI